MLEETRYLSNPTAVSSVTFLPTGRAADIWLFQTGEKWSDYLYPHRYMN
jgi:hypothetical protein